MNGGAAYNLKDLLVELDDDCPDCKTLSYVAVVARCHQRAIFASDACHRIAACKGNFEQGSRV